MSYIKKYEINKNRIKELYRVHQNKADLGLSKQINVIGQTITNILTNKGFAEIISYSWLVLDGGSAISYGFLDKSDGSIQHIATFVYRRKDVIEDIYAEGERHLEKILEIIDPFVKAQEE